MNLAMYKPTKTMNGERARNELLSALGEYRSRFPEEGEVVDRVMDFVSREPGCFERSTAEGHITGSAWVVDPSGERTLLTHHRKLDKWLQLGGHADGDGNVLRVAVTEAREESGIDDYEAVTDEIFDVDIHPIPARGSDAGHLHFDIRYALRAGHTDHVVSDESHDLAWVPIRELERYTTEESMLRMARKWLELSASLRT